MATKIAFSSPGSSVISFPKSSFRVSSSSHLSVKSPHKPSTSFRTTLPSLPSFGPSASQSNVFGSDSHSVFGGGFKSPYGGIHFAKPSTMSPQQAYALGYMAGHHSSNNSFVDEVKSGAGSFLGKALNIISRPLYGVAKGYDLATQHNHQNFGDLLGSNFFGPHSTVWHEFAKGFMEGVHGKSSETFGDILRRRNPHANKWAIGAAGFGLDVAADPLSYVGGVGVLGK